MSLIDQVERERHHVVVDVYSPTWNELLSQYSAGDIEISPDYQRAFRWNLFQQTLFIESLLLNIPTPPVFLAEKKDGRFEVIDGLQRFSTMLKFFSEEIFEPGELLPLSTTGADNEVVAPSILMAGPILEDLEGLTRATMPETLVRTLRYSRVQVILLKKESSSVAKYNVFTRLNRAGSQLSGQEIRNCSARLFDESFADDLRRLANLKSTSAAMSLSKADEQEMKAEENILRLLAFTYADLTNKNIADFLDDFMYKAASGEFQLSDRRKKMLEETFDALAEAFPRGESFRFYRNGEFSGGFSTNLFDIVGCGVYKNIRKVHGWSAAKLAKRIIEMHRQPEVAELTGAGSNTRKKMMGRVKFGQKWFA